MTKKKPTESEIMKALECCSKVVDEGCGECPMYEKDCNEVSLEKLALDLINRKNAENDKVRTELDRLTIYFDEAVEARLKTARAEAIKEYIERLRAYPIRYHIEHENLNKFVPFIDDIDLYQIAKEMGVR